MISKILSFVLFFLALVSAFMGISYTNKCGKDGLEGDRFVSNKTFLVTLVVSTIALALYQISDMISPDKWAPIILLLSVCIVAISTSSIGIEVKNKCTNDKLKSADQIYFWVIIGLSIAIFLAVTGLNLKHAKNSYKTTNFRNMFNTVGSQAKSAITVPTMAPSAAQ